MIDKVFIMGLRRGGMPIDASEINQMIGRCGRSYHQEGTATVIVPKSDLDLAEDYLNAPPKPVKSAMDCKALAFHCLAPVCRGEVFDEETFLKWAGRSLMAIQGGKPDWGIVKTELLEEGAAEEIEAGKGNGIAPTWIGKAAFDFYFPPMRIRCMAEKMEEAAGLPLSNPVVMAWLLGYEGSPAYLGEMPELDDFEYSAKDMELSFYGEEEFDSFVYYCLLTNTRHKAARALMDARRSDFGRLASLARRVAFERGMGGLFDRPFSVWEAAVARKCGYESGELALEFPEASNAVLKELGELGLHNLEQAREYVAKGGHCSLAMRSHLEEKLANKENCGN